jgi:hypothetical protein
LELGISQGYAIAVGGPRQETGDSYAMDASVLYRFLNVLAAGVEVGYWPGAPFRGVSADGTTVITSDMKVDTFHAGPVMRVESARPWFLGLKPYVLAAGAMYHSHRNAGVLNTSDTNTSVAFAAPRPVIAIETNPDTPATSGDDWNIGYSAGIGVTGDISDHVSLGLDLRYHQVLLGLDDVPDLHYLIPSLRLSYRF